MRHLRRITNTPVSIGSSLFFDDFNSLFDELLGPMRTSPTSPRQHVEESEDHYHLSFDLPGVDAKDLDVSTNNGRLTVRAERSNGRDNQVFKFEKSFSLPNSVNGEAIEAHYENGVLDIVIPKAKESEGRKVEIQSGKPGFFSRLLGEKKETEAS